MLAGIFNFYPAITSSISSVTIKNTGTLSILHINASSGSVEDIQTAVDLIIAAGGHGIVYIPDGIFDFVIDPDKIGPTNVPTGVIIPGGVSVIGQGKEKTILRQPSDPPQSSTMFLVDGRNDLESRISSIGFDGYVETTEDFGNTGVTVLGAKDFRVDHCNFTDLSSKGIYVANNYLPYGVNRGVIDHCDFDNPYKDNLDIPDRLWGYGIIVVSTFYSWEPNIDNILGRYDDIENVVYIEDCTFRRTRHAIAANGGGHYVARYNYFTEMLLAHYGSYIDAHGSSGAAPAVGTRAIEVYNNVIEDSPCDERSLPNPAYWGQYLGMGVGIRGGGGVIFGNELIHGATGIKIYSDAVWEQCEPHDIWIWGNNFTDIGNNIVAEPPSVENEDYFLYEKPGYTPYPYPHPLTLTPP